jgi:hypothetical protein
MSRMSREFGLVLLGSGILTAGYFAAPSPEEEMERKADEQAAERTGHPHQRSHYGHVPLFLFVHSPAYAGNRTGRPASYSPTTRAGGFGSAGRAFSGGGS